MKDYKVKEELASLRQAFDELKLKFEVMVEALDTFTADKSE